tara:strand:+ start:144 stop:2801 length:2658 start_codon:yes stop_codon:yes gene_type:complete
MAMGSKDIAAFVAVFSILGLLLLLAVLLWALEHDWNAEPTSKAQPAAAAGASQGGNASSGNPSGSTAPAATGVGSFTQWRSPRSERLYVPGTRLDDLLRWSALDASVALHAYMRQMDWEERDALLGALPQIANCILGLDPTGGTTSRGWLNEQEDLLHEPHRHLRAANSLQNSLLELLSAVSPSSLVPPAEGSKLLGGLRQGAASGAAAPKQPARLGLLVEKLLEESNSPANTAMQYTFFAKHLPLPARTAIANGHAELVPPIFLAKLQARNWQFAQGAGAQPLGAQRLSVAQDGRQQGSSPPAGLVLRAWEYYLFCFCLWPNSQGGEYALETFKPLPTAPEVASRILHMNSATATEAQPLYHQLLSSYLKYFVPVATPLDSAEVAALRSNAAPRQGLGPGGTLLIEAMAQFWLCENAPPNQAPQIQQTFRPTSAAILGCLDVLVRHLNQHEVARVTQHLLVPNEASAHLLLQKPMYDFFGKQLSSLPDISSRVILLVRVVTRYLQPWAPAKASLSSSVANISGHGDPTMQAAAASAAAALNANPESWPWAHFACHYYPFYARLLMSVARETCLSRFNLTDKSDLRMLREVAALFETPGLLPVIRKMAETAEQLLKATPPHGWAAGNPALCEPLWRNLQALVGPNWGLTCEQLTPTRLCAEVDMMEKHLQLKSDELRNKQTSGYATSVQIAAQRAQRAVFSDTMPPLQALDELRQSAQRILHALQPADYELSQRRPAEPAERKLPLQLVGARSRPLSSDERELVISGRGRCSALAVPFQATDRQPIRPVGSDEVHFLVEVAEAIAVHIPPWMLKLGIHPRLLASRHWLVLVAAVVLLPLTYPASGHAVLVLFWAIFALAAATWGAILVLREIQCNLRSSSRGARR